MSDSSRRRVPFLAILFVGTVLLLELIAHVGLRATGVYPTARFADMYETSSCLKSSEFNYGKHIQSADDMEVALGRVPHPFFGFVVNTAGADAEWRRRSVGPDYENELRYRIQLGDDPRPENTFTVGIFGASVAVSFAGHVMADDWFTSELKRRIPTLADREIVIRNMAIGASRQPTQFAVATHYRELFDLTINLDGYSEQAIDNHPEYPIEFPMFSEFFFSREGASRYVKTAATEYVCQFISKPGTYIPLRYSNVYYLAWYSASAAIKRSLDPRRASASATPDEVFTKQEIRRLYAAYFERYTRYQHQIMAGNNVSAYFFLQPNQYVPGSKPFSAGEKRDALNDGFAAEHAARYALLRESAARLAEEGRPVFDLTQVFRDVTETTYVDSCCHLNDRGNRVVAEAVLERIAARENAPPAPEANSATERLERENQGIDANEQGLVN